MRSTARFCAAVLLAATAVVTTMAQHGTSDGQWRTYHGDFGATRYAPLDQITRDNVADLRVAWRVPTSLFQPLEYKNESTPLYVDGLLYFTAGQKRAVVAVDPETGRLVWSWQWDEGERWQRAPRRNSGRGVSYWTDGRGDARIVVVTPGYSLVALDAKTGRPVPGFGRNGIVDMMAEKARLEGYTPTQMVGAIGNSSPPIVARDTIVVGAALVEGSRPQSRANVRGTVLAFDARTGRFRWSFAGVPAPGTPGSETWEGDSLRYTGNGGVWAPMAYDDALGYLYLPVEAPTNDYYGGQRLGDNLFSSSLVAVDIATGRRVWHRQIVHHDIFDWDNTTAPMLIDLNVEGKAVRAVVQLTKQSYAYTYDRVTGEPVWPIEERPVPPSDVPGERAAATQPVPVKPPAFDRQGVSRDDLVDFTPTIRAEAERLTANYRFGPLFTPAGLADAPDGTRGTLTLPSSTGGVGWEHAAFDPETGRLYVGTMTAPQLRALVPGPNDTGYIMQFGSVTPFGLPVVKPPYGRITALDMQQGTTAWTRANGPTPRDIRNHPLLRGMALPETGSRSKAGLLVTRTLLFAGEGWGGQPYFRAHDKATGAVVWETRLPGVQAGLPMTYMHKGRQYLVMTVGDPDTDRPAELIAFSLVDKPTPRPGTPALALPVTAVSEAERADGWQSLFPGPGMAGWYPQGGAEWTVEGDVLTATGRGGPSYLRSTAALDHVELSLDVWTEPGSDAGVLVRCPLSDTAPAGPRTCHEANLGDAHPVYPTGSLVDLVRAGSSPVTAGRWTRLVVRADGPRLSVSLNGAAVADAWDDRLRGGTLALQVGGAGSILRVRHARMRALGR